MPLQLNPNDTLDSIATSAILPSRTMHPLPVPPRGEIERGPVIPPPTAAYGFHQPLSKSAPQTFPGVQRVALPLDDRRTSDAHIRPYLNCIQTSLEVRKEFLAQKLEGARIEASLELLELSVRACERKSSLFAAKRLSLDEQLAELDRLTVP